MHHIGSASPRIVSELAERHPGTVPSDPDALRDFFAFRDFAHFVDVYLAVVALVKTPEDVRLLTYEVAREMAQGQGLRYAELTCTPYTSVRPGRRGPRHADRGLHRGHRGRPGRGRAGPRARAALDLRHPGGVRRALGGRDAVLRPRPPARGPGRLRPGRPGDRRVPSPVPAALRRGARGRAAQRAARRRDHRPRDGLGRDPAARCRADRSRHVGGPGPGAARPPGRDGHPARGVPLVQRRHPRGGVARRAPAAHLRRRRA